MAVSCLFAFCISPLFWCFALEIGLLGSLVDEADGLVVVLTLQAVDLVFSFLWTALSVKWVSTCTLLVCVTMRTKDGRGCETICLAVAPLWVWPRSAKISKIVQHFRLWEPYLEASFNNQESCLLDGEVSDKETMPVLSMQVLHRYEKAAGSLDFSHPSLPPSHLQALTANPLVTTPIRVLGGSPSEMGYRRAKCLLPHREDYSFIWWGSLLIQTLRASATVPWSEGRGIFTFPLTVGKMLQHQDLDWWGSSLRRFWGCLCHWEII